jgi:hypothetical protein
MHERAKVSFFLFFFTFESSLTLVNDSDFLNLLFKYFMLRKPQKPSLVEASNEADLNDDNSSKSVSVFEVFNARTSLIKSGWLFSIDKEDVLCSINVSFLHALASGNEFGRTAKGLLGAELYVPPERSSRNSSSSEPEIRSSAREDCRESDWGRKKWSFNLH